MDIRNRVVEARLISADDLRKNPRNWRKHPPAQQQALRKVLKEIGFAGALLAYDDPEYGLTLIDGHLRKDEVGGMSIHVLMTDLTRQEANALLALHDPLAAMAQTDGTLLRSLIDELPALDLGDVGAAIVALVGLVKETAGDTPEAQIDRAQELADQYGTQLGQIWQLGKHRLAIGDSTDKGVIDALMQGKKADMVFTDPPYNIASDGSNFAADAPNQKAYSQLKDAAWDKDFDIKTIIPNLVLFSGDRSSVYICTSHFLFGVLYEELKMHFDFVSYVVWCKPNPMPSLAKTHWTWGTELILYAANSGHVFNFPHEGHALNWWDIPQTQANRVHPTQKPIEIPTHAITHSSAKNALVFDPFLGSGTTLIAAHQTGRICYGVEIEPKYAAVCLQRWEALTGQTAALLP